MFQKPLDTVINCLFVSFVMILVGVCFANVVQALGAQTTVVTEVTAQAGGELPKWLQFIMSFEFVWKGLVTLGGLLITWLFKIEIFKKIDDAAAQEAIAAIQAGVVKTYTEFVWDVKAKAEDGKLTVGDRIAARNQAFENAKQIATGPAKAMLLKWGKDRVSAYIEQIVTKLKEKREKKNAGKSGEEGRKVPGS